MKHEKEFEKSFPAQFIAEGLDQTRGWFYTLMVPNWEEWRKSGNKHDINFVKFEISVNKN